MLIRKMKKREMDAFDIQSINYLFKDQKIYIKNNNGNNITIDDLTAIYIKDYILYYNIIELNKKLKNIFYQYTDLKILYIEKNEKDIKLKDNGYKLNLENYEFNYSSMVIPIWKIPYIIFIKYNNYFPIKQSICTLVDEKIKLSYYFRIYPLNLKVKIFNEKSVDAKLYKQSENFYLTIISKIKENNNFEIMDDDFVLLIKKEYDGKRTFKPVSFEDYKYNYRRDNNYKKFIEDKKNTIQYLNLYNPNIYTIIYKNILE